MIIDYLAGDQPADIHVDLCIIGGGAAGIAIARSFAGSTTTVYLIESGGMSGEEHSQALCEGSSAGDIDFNPGTSRMRVFGGSCNLWGGGCIPLGRQDLEPRDWVPHSGWPISYADLEPYYARAREYCGIGDLDFVDGTFAEPGPRGLLSFDEEKLVNQFFARSPILFGDTYRDELERASNITVLLHGNLLELTPTEDGRNVLSARIGSLSGARSIVRARHYVLASGGIENARLMLLSNSVVPQGLGNQRDVVGRYFMDHPSGTLGTLTADAPHRITRPYERRAIKGEPPAFPEIALSPQFQRHHRVLNGRVHPFGVEGPLPRGIRALRELRSALRTTVKNENALLEEKLSQALRNAPAGHAIAMPPNLGIAALRVGLGVGDLVRACVHKLADRPTVASSHVDLVGYFEQAPNPDSRVTLGHQIDAFGQRKVNVHWRLTPLDHQTYQFSGRLFGEEIARVGNGQFRLSPWLSDPTAKPEVHGTAHHMGTTRMSDDPTTGVVDRQCKVHGMDNLHIAGSSVFPTGGWAFPTFTIVALSLRLADELRGLLAACANTGLL
ncbi:MAG TPA: GMC oxidoreductase [Dyella sp.]|uniref:GMC oxidoreductase n=1 Tax=Dyella sp. TaxID=1869338 RepID=UPI002D77AF98|nr:GMC oxidoreductase [Dyella sp.]HET6554379.1 GMC oxidoreductase [Dyella sp.]